MTGELLAFIILSAGALLGAVMLIFFQKHIHALLSIVLTFVSIAGLYILLSAEFIAGAQILIYSGAITIILLFAIMLTKNNDPEQVKSSWMRRGFTFLAVTAFGLLIFNGIKNLTGNETASTLHVNNTEQIGVALYTKYIIPFELVSILLLAVLVGAIVLAKRERKEE